MAKLRREQLADGIIDNTKQAFGPPAAPTDVVLLNFMQQYVQDQIGASNLKNVVKVATITNGSLPIDFVVGKVVDGYTLALGDRILIKNQTNGAENGIFTVNATGAPTRAKDADTTAEIQDAVVYVSRGTVNQDTGWKLVTDNITLDTTPLVFTPLVSAFLTSSSIVKREVPSGTINGTNKAFTLANTIVVGSEDVYLNGLLQITTTDYTISGSTITFVNAPIVGDVITVSYVK